VKRVFRTLATALCITALAIVAVAIAVPALLGMQRYVITGGSMTGTISKGSVIYSRLTPTERLKVGDIITFRPPGFASSVTHRIIGIDQGQHGKRVYRTKGDFNEVADPWVVNLVEPQQARYVLHIPYIGYVLAALAIRQVRMVLIGLPALLVAISLLWSLWSQAGDELAKQETEADPGDAGIHV
jgi:signal peptidase I